jgi:dTDP-4-dehydrorhamnose 3,5-epimerase
MKIKVFSNSAFVDRRGIYWTSWEKKKFIPRINFNHDKFSLSKKNVLRGLHGDRKTWKLVSCVYGEVFFVIVNYNKKSKNYLKFKTFLLSHENRKQILVPPNFLNGYLCLSRECLFHYKLSYKNNYVDVKNQISINWKDKRLKIKWPIKKPILSKRDK